MLFESLGPMAAQTGSSRREVLIRWVGCSTGLA